MSSKKAKERVLDVPIDRYFFDQILRGTKTEEFRERSEYWKKRLEGRDYDLVRFRAGYMRDSPRMYVKFKGIKKSTDGGYAIQLGTIVRTQHCKTPAKKKTSAKKNVPGSSLVGRLTRIFRKKK